MTDILIFLLITIFLTFLSRKLNLLPNFTGENHQYFLKEKKILILGEFIILLSDRNPIIKIVKIIKQNIKFFS